MNRSLHGNGNQGGGAESRKDSWPMPSRTDSTLAREASCEGGGLGDVSVKTVFARALANRRLIGGLFTVAAALALAGCPGIKWVTVPVPDVLGLESKLQPQLLFDFRQNDFR